LAVTLLLLVPCRPGGAAACALDNIPSLEANGVHAKPTTEVPTSVDGWAPFTVPVAFARGTSIRFSERRADLARSLPPATLAAPYRWAFGDGFTALGHEATHQYARAGRFRLVVYGYYDGPTRETRGWFLFDSALVTVVSASPGSQR
jgi:hypothetical protein